MHIDVIDDLQTLGRFRRDWDAVYAADPESQFFLSWTWMSKWLEVTKKQWFILAAKPSADAPAYIAFFPLGLRVGMRERGGFYNELVMAGSHTADYTGFICMPEFQDHAIPAFAEYVKRLTWTDLTLEFIRASDRRLNLFLGSFSRGSFKATDKERINKRDSIDLCVCPYVNLTCDWEAYLVNRLSPNTRQKVRRFLRKIDTSGEFRVTHAGAEDFGEHIEILLRFWAMKWGSRKGEDLDKIRNIVRTMLTHCAEAGSLFLPVLWREDAPLGALAFLIDEEKRSLRFWIGARDEAFNNPPPGFVLHAYSIRHAISNGFTTYDFLRGNEPYKYSFGAEECRIRHVVISSRVGQNVDKRLDRRSLPEALQRTTQLYRAGRLAEAERGYRQLLDLDPECADALYGLGRLMMANGNHYAAQSMFKALVALRPDSYKAWFCLGEAHLARRQFSEAADAFREAIERRPELSVAHHKLGQALLQLGRSEEAAGAFETALALQAAT